MSQTAQFSDAIPAHYDAHLGPFLFEFYAADLAGRIDASRRELLETACGTGISTAFLRRAIGAEPALVATDVSEAMLDFARSRRGELANTEFRPADAAELPFDDASFDALVSQFGLMFVPDKAQAMREAHRVLRAGGQLAFNVWGARSENPFVDVAQDAIATFFDSDPPQFLYVPWSYHDPVEIRELVEGAGFRDVAIEAVSHVSERPSARDVAIGLVRGNPTIQAVEAGANGTVDEVVDAVAAALAEAFGDGPFRAPMQALVVTARR